ncbi:hypothetical protein [Lacinutrix chionoecetis]
MKTFKLFLLIAFISTNVNAQLDKGNWLVGGSGEYSSQNSTFDDGSDTKIDRITIKPNIGYFIKEKFALGATLGYTNQSIFTTYGVGLFSRYYFLKPEKTFNLFAQVHFDIVHVVSDIEGGARNNTSNFYGVRVGQVVFFNSTVGLEFAVEYERGNLPTGVSNNIKAVIGFQIHLEKK